MVMKENLYGLLAEFNTPTELVLAAHEARKAGYTKTDGFSPFPIHEMDEALGIKRSILSFLIFGGGLLGLLGGLGMQAYLLAVEYPINVGGRPRPELAFVHSHHFRMHCFAGFRHGRLRHAFFERAAAAVPPGL